VKRLGPKFQVMRFKIFFTFQVGYWKWRNDGETRVCCLGKLNWGRWRCLLWLSNAWLKLFRALLPMVLGWKHIQRSKGCQSKSPFPKIAHDMCHFCVGL
jgi:hypothetical protein